MKLLSLLVALLVISCSSKSDKSPAIEADENTLKATNTCEADVAELRNWLATLAKEGGRVEPKSKRARDISLVISDAALAEHSELAITLSLNPKVVMVEGSPVSEVIDERLTEVLKAVKGDFEKRGHNLSNTLYVLVDSKTTWQRVVAATDASAAAGYTRLQFAFSGSSIKPTLSAPPHSSIHKEIMAFVAKVELLLESDDGEVALSASTPSLESNFWQQANSDCAPLAAQWKSAAKVAPDKRKTHLTDGVADAIAACNCSVDIPALREIYWYTMSWSAGPSTKYATVKLDPSGLRLAAPSDASWQETHAKLLELATSEEPPSIVMKIE